MPLTIETDGNVAIVRRRFAAPPERVWDAHVDPEIVVKWLTGPEGWQFTKCDADPRPGGHIYYAWADANGENGFHLKGEYIELERPNRIVHVERMHIPDPTPDNRVETIFEAAGEGTRMIMTMTVPTDDIMAMMLETGMEEGMETSYVRLETVL